MENQQQSLESAVDQNSESSEHDADFVRELTEKVYALWLRDVRLERERLGIRANRHTGIESNFRRGQS